jgi:hypothetical protein
MAILMFGDFNGMSTAQLGRYYQQSASATVVNNASNRFSGVSHGVVAAVSVRRGFRTNVFSPISSGVVGFSVLFDDTTTETFFLSLLDTGTVEHIRLSRNSSGQINILRVSTSLTGGSSSSSFPNETWLWVELKFSIADSIGANSVQLWVNGVLEATVATGQDTRNAGNASIDAIWLGSFVTSANPVGIRYSEFYVSDSTTPLGDCRVRTLIPSAEGDTQNFSSTGASHYTEVDDNPADDNSTYVESATPNHIELFQMSGISSNPSVIHAVSPWLCTRKTDAGHKTFAPILRLSSTNYEQSGVNAFDNYSYNNPVILELNPDSPGGTGVWDITSLDNTQVGLRVVS